MTPDIYQKSFIILRHLELIDATCFNRKRLYSVFQFLAHASNKDKQVKLMTCWGLVWSAKDEGVVLYHMLKNLMYIMVQHFFFDFYWFKPEFVWVLENLESPGILLWHFPGLESLGKVLLVLESAGNLLNSGKKYEMYGRQQGELKLRSWEWKSGKVLEICFWKRVRTLLNWSRDTILW